jgi:hypothetical protein
MFRQTIALFRYLLLGFMSIKVTIFLLIITVGGFLSGQFISELAIINGAVISLAASSELVRYGLIVFMIVTIAHQVSADYELGQFDRILSMPISRTQYVLAQSLSVLTIGFIFSLSVILSVMLMSTWQMTVFWFISVYLELILIGIFTLLATLVLEKLPVAIIFSLSFYLLCRLAPIINSIFQQSSEYYTEEASFQFTHEFFSLLLYVLPDSEAFANNNLLFDSVVVWNNVLSQFVHVTSYGCFLLAICLIDFYRKEFNH